MYIHFGTYTMAPKSHQFSIFCTQLFFMSLFFYYLHRACSTIQVLDFCITCCCYCCCWCCMQTARIIMFSIAKKQRINRTQNIFCISYRLPIFLLRFTISFFYSSFICACIEYQRDTLNCCQRYIYNTCM